MGPLPGRVVQAQLALVGPLEVSFGVNPYIQEKPNPRGMKIFAKQSTVDKKIRILGPDWSPFLDSGEGDFFAFIVTIDFKTISTTMTSYPTMMCE
jgi:hypothetical protein